ncbi:MAG TPA: hypothetical protein DCK95_08790 [Anaerolineaceae bacterium]|nr:hypothetical protein [Anaerolineaceae bacterium]
MISPPVELPEISSEEVEKFKENHNCENVHPIIGMAARFASEKGVEVLLNAMPHILEELPDAQVWFAGPYEHIVGEEAYFKRLEPAILDLQKQDAWKFMGSLDPAQMAAFYPNIDLLVIPSLNSTEAFGLVQIEAMINGVPSIASNLPGVRQPVKRHAMGKVIPIGDSDALSQAVVEIMKDKAAFQGDIMAIKKMYAPDSIAIEYENLFNEIMNEIK